MNNKQKLQNFIDYQDKNKIIEYIKTDEYNNNDGYYAFNVAFIGTDDKYYNILSDLVHNSSLHYDTAVKMAYEAVQIVDELLTNNVEVNEDTEFDEYVDRFVPIYNYELLNFLKMQHWLVDETISEFGKKDSIIDDIAMCYYIHLERITQDLIGEITK